MLLSIQRNGTRQVVVFLFGKFAVYQYWLHWGRLLSVVAVLSLLVIGQAVCSDGKPAQTKRIVFADRLPYGLAPIDYGSKTVNNAVARLNRRLDAGKLRLRFEGPNGYLLSVLKALDVDVKSQLLVFSKTAVNQRLIGPKNPRAVYFSDDIAIGWVPGAASLEIAASDPQKGTIFYTLTQEATGKPRFVREENCLACHAGRTTLGVPGHMVRSFLVKDKGKPVSGYSRITHETAYVKRWGGWYVTGTHGTLTHMGNVIGEKANRRFRDDRSLMGNVTDLKRFIDVTRYPSPHSDVVAHIVLNHQAHGLNLITRVNFEARLRRRSDAEDRLLRYFLFVDEAPLTAPVRGTSQFAAAFERRGKRDARKRSLRQLDLKTRLFKYRLSYLIYTRPFDGLPGGVKLRFYRRLWNVLTGNDKSRDFAKIPGIERKAILAILISTKSGLPEYWTLKNAHDRRRGKRQ